MTMMTQYQRREVQRDCDLIREIGETEFDLASWLIAKGETPQLDSTKAQYVSWVLQKSPEIKCLDMIDCFIIESDSEEAEKAERILVDFLHNSNSLTSIKIGISQIDMGADDNMYHAFAPGNLDWIGHALHGNKSIVSLGCYLCELEDVGRILCSTQDLERMELVCCSSSGHNQQSTSFLAGIGQQNHLLELSLNNCFFDQQSTSTQILHYVANNTTTPKCLKTLKLNGLDLTSKSLNPITRLLENKESSLQVLDLEGNPALFLNKNERDAFATALKDNRTIHVVRMFIQKSRWSGRQFHDMEHFQATLQSCCDRNQICNNLLVSMDQCQDADETIGIGGLAIQHLAAHGKPSNATPIYLTLAKLSPMLFH